MKGTTVELVDDSTSNATKEWIDASTRSLLPSTLFRGDSRELKELVLREVGIRWNDLTNFGNLTTLALHNQNHINDFDDLAEIFHPLGGLETLALYRCLPTGEKADGLGATCFLSCLKNLKLTDDPASIDTFMRRVSLRAERLEIDCDVPDVSETLAFKEVYQHRLDSSLPENAERLDIMLDLKKTSHIGFCTDATASTPF
ncbi:hypothetical protein BDN71DRAFT_1446104 [Pleurotus eryngii]|uniref:Uncharacterized protein n=1 Tax=Pleurotus eryngii TaxID=5323 RepID=A0A9P6A1B5_PLEER|nr:hypothetical protein BDN71DRAFT_1446104 [Pleurotus eryngii]